MSEPSVNSDPPAVHINDITNMDDTIRAAIYRMVFDGFHLNDPQLEVYLIGRLNQMGGVWFCAVNRIGEPEPEWDRNYLWIRVNGREIVIIEYAAHISSDSDETLSDNSDDETLSDNSDDDEETLSDNNDEETISEYYQ